MEFFLSLILLSYLVFIGLENVVEGTREVIKAAKDLNWKNLK